MTSRKETFLESLAVRTQPQMTGEVPTKDSDSANSFLMSVCFMVCYSNLGFLQIITFYYSTESLYLQGVLEYFFEIRKNTPILGGMGVWGYAEVSDTSIRPSMIYDYSACCSIGMIYHKFVRLLYIFPSSLMNLYSAST